MSTGTGTEQTVCVDCRHPLHQEQEKALGREWQMVWADAIGTWICPVTGDEHRPEHRPAPSIIGSIQPLTEVTGSNTGYRVICRDCGDVTREESAFTVNAWETTMQQAGLYRQRHLARHLAALSAEMTEAAR